MVDGYKRILIPPGLAQEPYLVGRAASWGSAKRYWLDGSAGEMFGC